MRAALSDGGSGVKVCHLRCHFAEGNRRRTAHCRWKQDRVVNQNGAGPAGTRAGHPKGGDALFADFWCRSARGTVAIYWSERANWSHAPVMPWYTGAIPASGQGSVVIPDRFAPWRFFNLLERPETGVPVKPDRQP